MTILWKQSYSYSSVIFQKGIDSCAREHGGSETTRICIKFTFVCIPSTWK